MRSKQGQNICILMKDGSARRVPQARAKEFLAKGSAKRYISKTVYKALSLGIEVKDLSTRDEKGKLKEQIRSLTEKKAKRQSKEKDEEAEE